MAREQSVNSDRSPLQQQLGELNTLVEMLSQQYQQDSGSLLALLRTLERLHRQIRDELFDSSLPNTRQALYQLLRDIEESGGWPYIERMKLQEFLKQLHPDSTPSTSED